MKIRGEKKETTSFGRVLCEFDSVSKTNRSKCCARRMEGVVHTVPRVPSDHGARVGHDFLPYFSVPFSLLSLCVPLLKGDIGKTRKSAFGVCNQSNEGKNEWRESTIEVNS